MKFKRVVCLTLACVILLSLTLNVYASTLNGFDKSDTYADEFYDVDYGDWYYYYVAFAYEYGIMNGVDEHYFSPSGSITIAEVITIAARMNAAYYGREIDMSAYYGRASAAAWFTPYMVYAAECGIITATEFSSGYFENAKRAEIAHILYNALPNCYEKINDISPIPDVGTGDLYYYEILSMYEAGVLTGNDEYGTFYPYENVQRCSVSAMVARIADTSLRVYFTLNENKPYKTCVFSWQYPLYWGNFGMNIDISYYDYNYFASIPRSRDYSVYAKDRADETALMQIAQTLKSYAMDNGFYSEYDIVGFIAAFVQSLEYQDDFLYKGFKEYPKYPIETLFDMGGDCEDTSVLLAKMLKLLGYGAVLLESTDHMAVGVQTSGDGNLTFNGNQYYYIETTDPGWRVGDVPPDMVGVSMQVVYI